MGKTAKLTWLEFSVAIAVVVLMAAMVYLMGGAPRKEAGAAEKPGGFHNRAAAAAIQIKQSIAMAGSGMTRMEAIHKGGGPETDTLTVYSNSNENGLQTTLRNSVAVGDRQVTLFEDPGFTAGAYLGIVDGENQEYARIKAVSGDGQGGFRVLLQAPLTQAYAAATCDVFPVHQEVFFVEAQRRCFVRYRDGDPAVLAPEIREFRLQLRDQYGALAGSYQNVKAVSFSLAGRGAAATGIASQRSLSSASIARNGR